jgi:hypothetical protein
VWPNSGDVLDVYRNRRTVHRCAFDPICHGQPFLIVKGQTWGRNPSIRGSRCAISGPFLVESYALGGRLAAERAAARPGRFDFYDRSLAARSGPEPLRVSRE